LRFEAADHITMAIAEHGRRGIRLTPLGDQHRTAAYRVVDDLALKAEPRQRRRDLIGEIGAQHRRARLDLALGRDPDAPGEIGGKAALVEIRFGGGNGGGAAHAGAPDNNSEPASSTGPIFFLP
jgi:hypothetical protein